MRLMVLDLFAGCETLDGSRAAISYEGLMGYFSLNGWIHWALLAVYRELECVKQEARKVRAMTRTSMRTYTKAGYQNGEVFW